MTLGIEAILVLVVLSLIAGLITAITGAGNTILLPGMLAVGIPPHLALGTMRITATASLFAAAMKYIRSGLFTPRLWLAAIFSALFGAIFGGILALIISSESLETILPIFIAAIAIYALLPQKKSDAKNTCEKSTNKKGSIISGTILGIYSGFIGLASCPLWSAFCMNFFKLDPKRATANAIFLCFITNITTLLVFMWYGQVDYLLGAGLAALSMVGAYFGGRILLKLACGHIKNFTAFSTSVIAGKLALMSWL